MYVLGGDAAVIVGSDLEQLEACIIPIDFDNA